MEVAEPARRRPHPQGCNEEEDGRDAVFRSAASARNGAARGKNCGKRSAGRCGYEATGRLTSIMTRQRWFRGERTEDGNGRAVRNWAKGPAKLRCTIWGRSASPQETGQKKWEEGRGPKITLIGQRLSLV